GARLKVGGVHADGDLFGCPGEGRGSWQDGEGTERRGGRQDRAGGPNASFVILALAPVGPRPDRQEESGADEAADRAGGGAQEAASGQSAFPQERAPRWDGCVVHAALLLLVSVRRKNGIFPMCYQPGS